MKLMVQNLIKYFEIMDTVGLRDISNKAIEQAVMSEDHAYVDISLIAYALSKLVSKPHFYKLRKWKVFQKQLIAHLNSITDKTLDKVLGVVLKDIQDFDKEAGNYVQDVIYKARVKQASRAYAMGLSLGKAAELTSVDKAFLLSYIGYTKIHDLPFTQSKPAIDRYKYLKELLS